MAAPATITPIRWKLVLAHVVTMVLWLFLTRPITPKCGEEACDMFMGGFYLLFILVPLLLSGIIFCLVWLIREIRLWRRSQLTRTPTVVALIVLIGWCAVPALWILTIPRSVTECPDYSHCR